MLRTLKIVFLIAIVGVIALVIVRGIQSRIVDASMVKERTADQAVLSVSVVHPKSGGSTDEISLPGNIQAFSDAPVYARTSGYLKRWYFDIGAHVKTGDLLAEIESPEIDQQLSQAKAELGTSQANVKLAETTYNRYKALLATDSIARQDVDNASGAYDAAKAALASQSANIRRLEQLVGFEKVYAPFDGIITARNTDAGRLINAGNGGTAQELFHISSAARVRIFVSVPQMYSQAARAGVSADLTLPEAPGQHYRGTVARNSGAIDAATRTLLTEVDIDNPSGKLLPGAFAEVHLKLPSADAALVLPVTALIFRAQGLEVAVVRGDRAELIHVTQGRDFGTEVEITSGITANDLIIVNTPDSLESGTKVRVETGKDAQDK